MLKQASLINAVLGLLLACVIGCQPSETPSDPTPDLPQDQAAEAPDAEETASDEVDEVDEVTVEVKSWEEVQQMVADLRGQVVVIDIWSTWCVPCRIKFPDFVKLQESFPKGLTCISVSANYGGLPNEPPESFRDEVLEFLREQNATFPNVISSTPDQELYSIVGAAAVPIVMVYGADGELAQVFTNEDPQFGEGGFTYGEHVQPLVEQLLASADGS